MHNQKASYGTPVLSQHPAEGECDDGEYHQKMRNQYAQLTETNPKIDCGRVRIPQTT